MGKEHPITASRCLVKCDPGIVHKSQPGERTGLTIPSETNLNQPGNIKGKWQPLYCFTPPSRRVTIQPLDTCSAVAVQLVTDICCVAQWVVTDLHCNKYVLQGPLFADLIADEYAVVPFMAPQAKSVKIGSMGGEQPVVEIDDDMIFKDSANG